jgi:hypothetical protein
MINMNRKDVLRSQIVPPTWYVVDVKGLSTKPAKGDGSTNFLYEIVIAEGPFKDVPTKDFLINEKGIFGNGQAFFVACGFPKEMLEKLRTGEVEAVPIDEHAPVGKVIRAFVSNTKWENRVSNECTDFLPLSSAVPNAPATK